MPWSRRFDDAVTLPDGHQLLTLEDAARYIQQLPKAEQAKLHWQTATSILIGAAEDRDFVMHARIAMLRALHFGKAPPDVTPRKKAVKRYRIIR